MEFVAGWTSALLNNSKIDSCLQVFAEYLLLFGYFNDRDKKSPCMSRAFIYGLLDKPIILWLIFRMRHT
jgi:hypothetical protein